MSALLDFLVLLAWIFVPGATLVCAIELLIEYRERRRISELIATRVPMGRCEAGHPAKRADLEWMGYELGHRCPEHRLQGAA